MEASRAGTTNLAALFAANPAQGAAFAKYGTLTPRRKPWRGKVVKSEATLLREASAARLAAQGVCGECRMGRSMNGTCGC